MKPSQFYLLFIVLISQQQQPCGKVVMARVRRLRFAQGQARPTKSNKENGYVIKIKVMRLNREGGPVPLVRESQRPKVVPSLFIVA